MRYLRGDVLGDICGELGIRTRSRVVVTEFRQSMLIWNLDSGVEFNLDFKTSMLITRAKPVPEGYLVVFHEATSALLERLDDPDLMPWSEEREALLSELDYRKVSHPRGPHYPVSELFSSLMAHLAHLGSKIDSRRVPHGMVPETPSETSVASRAM